MPRCFLAKQAPSSVIPGPSEKWSEDDSPSCDRLSNRSTVGSISAAQAVQSIQEPVLPRPAEMNNNLNFKAVNAPSPASSSPPAIALHPERFLPKEPVMLHSPSSSSSSSDNPPAPVISLHAASSSVKHHPLLPSEPLPKPTSSVVSPPPSSVVVVKQEECKQEDDERMMVTPTTYASDPTLRVRTKEETDAAHDLLELSRSLPPLPPPQMVSLAHPPTPPTPEEPQYTTLIYITSPPSAAGSSPPFHVTSSQGHHHPTFNDFPLTPPTDSFSDSSSSIDLSSPVPSIEGDQSPSSSLTIADGRTKRNKEGSLKEKAKYVCSECGKNYATSSNLSRHKQTHRSLDSNNAKKCHICGKMYVSMPALSMHILTHNLNHKCNVCGKAFSRPWLLQGHLRSHTGHKPYSCTVCKKSFADRSNLRAHMQTHSPSKNFQCSRCHKTFALKSYLNKHYESACVRSSSSLEEAASPTTILALGSQQAT